MDGPRAVQLEEMDALRKLTDVVFRPGMPEQYPQLFNSDNLENLRVCFDGPICTSHVGMVQREAKLMWCDVRVCCIGAVATHPDYREQGLASACFDSAVEKAYNDGVDIMIVSGGRGLYTRNGCLSLGRDFRVKTNASSFGSITGESVTIEPVEKIVSDKITGFQFYEPVRFVRKKAEYDYFNQSGWAMNSPAEFVLIYDASNAPKVGCVMGYVVVRKAKPGEASSLIEFGGDRDAVLHALPNIIRVYHLSELSFQIMGSDAEMIAACKRAGLELTPTSASGTIKLINFPKLMTGMSPHFAKVLGIETADGLRFEKNDDKYIFAFGEEELILDRDTATRSVFGNLDGLPHVLTTLEDELGKNLRRILPLPTLWYGINYV